MPFFPGQAFTTNHPDKCNSLPVSLSTSALNLSSLLKPSKTWTACPVHKTSRSFLNRGLFLLKANKALHEPGVLPTSSVSFFPCPLFHVTSWSNWTTHSDPCAPVASCLSVPQPFSLEWLTSFKSLFFHPLTSFKSLCFPWVLVCHFPHFPPDEPCIFALPESFCAPLLPGLTLVHEADYCMFVLPMRL